MITVIFIAVVYLLSVVFSWWSCRLQSSKYWHNWLDEDCSFSIWWLMPIVNTIMSCMIFTSGYVEKLSENQSKTKMKKSKWLNTDL